MRQRTGWHLKPDELYAYHINPVDFPLLHTVLFQSGLRVEKLRFTRFKPEHAWLLLFYPLIFLATRIETGREEGERDLRRWMLHPAMLASEQLLLVARKPQACRP